jgi:uncharacterized repeat protein (TIGR03847 family)
MSDDFINRPSPVDAQRVRVEALGEPGQRRFRMLLALNGETHIIWMEKQQLQALALMIEQMFEDASSDSPMLQSEDVFQEFDNDADHQFRLGKVDLGFDEAGDSVVIGAYDLQQDEQSGQPALSVRLNRRQALALSADVATLAAAGRPRCPMCGAPKDPSGHVCPEQNGHLPLTYEQEEIEG